MRHQAQTDLMFYSPQYFTQKRNKIYYMLQKVEIFQAFYKNFFSSLHHFFLLLFSLPLVCGRRKKNAIFSIFQKSHFVSDFAGIGTRQKIQKLQQGVQQEGFPPSNVTLQLLRLCFLGISWKTKTLKNVTFIRTVS